MFNIKDGVTQNADLREQIVPGKDQDMLGLVKRTNSNALFSPARQNVRLSLNAVSDDKALPEVDGKLVLGLAKPVTIDSAYYAAETVSSTVNLPYVLPILENDSNTATAIYGFTGLAIEQSLSDARGGFASNNNISIFGVDVVMLMECDEALSFGDKVYWDYATQKVKKVTDPANNPFAIGECFQAKYIPGEAASRKFTKNRYPHIKIKNVGLTSN
jgi:hypothetical protein